MILLKCDLDEKSIKSFLKKLRDDTDTVFQREMVNFQLEEEKWAYVGLEDNSVENRKVNDCMTWGRSSGQRSDRETARITQDKQRVKEGQTQKQAQIQT